VRARIVPVVLGIACAVVLGLGGDVGAQSAPPKTRPTAPAPAAPAAKPKAPEPKAAEPRGRTAPGPTGIDRTSPVTIDADQLENLQKEGLVVFTGNVVAAQNNSTQYSDRMEVYLDAKGEGIVRTVSSGNVKIITRDCKIGTARRAEYYDAEQRVVLVGNARVWQEDNVVTGERITIFLAEDRSLVEGGKQERVKAVFYPRGQADATAANKPPAGSPCG
jgi:lipopolysaccharide export system protein LptA